MKKLTGLIAAPHTPFTKDNKVNFAAIDQIAELLIEQGGKVLMSAERQVRGSIALSKKEKQLQNVG